MWSKSIFKEVTCNSSCQQTQNWNNRHHQCSTFVWQSRMPSHLRKGCRPHSSRRTKMPPLASLNESDRWLFNYSLFDWQNKTATACIRGRGTTQASTSHVRTARRFVQVASASLAKTRSQLTAENDFTTAVCQTMVLFNDRATQFLLEAFDRRHAQSEPWCPKASVHIPCLEVLRPICTQRTEWESHSPSHQPCQPCVYLEGAGRDVVLASDVGRRASTSGTCEKNKSLSLKQKRCCN